MIDIIFDVEYFLAHFPAPFVVREMHNGPAGGPYKSSFIVRCKASREVLYSNAERSKATTVAIALNTFPAILMRLKKEGVFVPKPERTCLYCTWWSSLSDIVPKDRRRREDVLLAPCQMKPNQERTKASDTCPNHEWTLDGWRLVNIWPCDTAVEECHGKGNDGCGR